MKYFHDKFGGVSRKFPGFRNGLKWNFGSFSSTGNNEDIVYWLIWNIIPRKI